MSTKARAQLIELGEKVLAAQHAFFEAKATWYEAVEAAYDLQETGVFADLTVEDEEQCFRASCRNIGVAYDHHAFAEQRASLARRKNAHQEARLEGLRANAEMN